MKFQIALALVAALAVGANACCQENCVTVVPHGSYPCGGWGSGYYGGSGCGSQSLGGYYGSGRVVCCPYGWGCVRCPWGGSGSGSAGCGCGGLSCASGLGYGGYGASSAGYGLGLGNFGGWGRFCKSYVRPAVTTCCTN